MKLFDFIATVPTVGYYGTPYELLFYKECTIREFIDEVLKRNEWGTIHINDYISCSYEKDKLKTPLSHAILDATIKSATAHGGWSNVDYWLDILEGSYKLRFEYTQTLKEIVHHESEIKKLQKKAHDLEEKMERIEKGEVYLKESPPPHLDKDGCVYWDSLLVEDK
ncbi:MAG: hypothetical protein LIR46_02920 [Bacteroidota bacterium]|nr:hypothetical protein [Bacteroidota bacterium]